MEGYLLIILFTLLNLGESVVVKNYAKRYGDGGMLMNSVIAFFACIFFVITDTGGFYAPAEMIPLALINTVLYASGFYFTYVAYRIGPYGLTRLISSFSLLFSISYGIIFLNEPTTAFTYIGIALILAAGALVNSSKKSGESDDVRVSFKWFICVLISVIANGFISILTRMQQIQFENACSYEFQIISIGGSCIILLILGLINDRRKLKNVAKNGIFFGMASGQFNGSKNFVTLAIYLFLPLSVISPTETGLNLVVAFLTSVFIYKEKYSLLQKIGVLCGAIAVVLLALK